MAYFLAAPDIAPAGALHRDPYMEVSGVRIGESELGLLTYPCWGVTTTALRSNTGEHIQWVSSSEEDAREVASRLDDPYAVSVRVLRAETAADLAWVGRLRDLIAAGDPLRAILRDGGRSPLWWRRTRGGGAAA